MKLSQWALSHISIPQWLAALAVMPHISSYADEVKRKRLLSCFVVFFSPVLVQPEWFVIWPFSWLEQLHPLHLCFQHLYLLHSVTQNKENEMVLLHEKKTGSNICYFKAIVSLRKFEKKVNLGEDCFSLSLQSTHKIQVPTQKKKNK